MAKTGIHAYKGAAMVEDMGGCAPFSALVTVFFFAVRVIIY